ncbi:MAG: OsmC family peroxiredoxin [Rikenellaceae bacterium]|nr:OsmC family peroxiredoxin [Rikenellaceae bacterium]
MIEKVTLQLTAEGKFELNGKTSCEELNPKALMLYAGAKCAGLTVLHIMKRERMTPKRLEITLSGELSTDTLQAESVFREFHMVYNVECTAESDQTRASHAIELAHEKHCGLVRMLSKIAPVSHEVAIVTTEPAKA